MENVIDIRMALEQIGTGWQFGGSVTAGTQATWEAVTWEDARDKPTWDALCAAYNTSIKETSIKESILLLEAQQTDRRIREATLTEEGKLWLKNLNDQIVAKRAELAAIK